MGGPAWEQEDRPGYFEFFNKHLQSRCPDSIKLYIGRKRGRGGMFLLLKFCLRGNKKKHSYHLSASPLFQLHRACNPMTPCTVRTFYLILLDTPPGFGVWHIHAQQKAREPVSSMSEIPTGLRSGSGQGRWAERKSKNKSTEDVWVARKASPGHCPCSLLKCH